MGVVPPARTTFYRGEQTKPGTNGGETMKKKAVALAVGALFAAPAGQAQLTMGNETTGTVQVYGKLYPEFGIAKGQGSTQVGSGVSTLVSNTAIFTAANAGATFIAAEGRIPDHLNRNIVDSQNS